MDVLLELRPAFEGHAGIPQETRLLFRGLGALEGVRVHGLLQTGNRLLSPGLPSGDRGVRRLKSPQRIDALSRVVVSIAPDELPDALVARLRLIRLVAATAGCALRSLFHRRTSLGGFDGTVFRDFIWRALFAPTLPASDFMHVTGAPYRVARLPWSAAHALGTLPLSRGRVLYPRLDTRGLDIFIAETPYPGRVDPRTQLVVRYHDAFPLLMPHTIHNRARHRQAHFAALRRNAQDGAWFACVSEASRRDLVSILPEVEARTVTIPNMLAAEYFEEPSTPAGVPVVLRARVNARIWAKAQDAWGRRGRSTGLPLRSPEQAPYLLMVSTIEPRKNHLALLAAWEWLRANGHPRLELVVVGTLGWGHAAIVEKMLPWIADGSMHLLEEVRASELRLLYRHATATVCPSYGEGFGFSGVEAMRCGGVVVASDIASHREVYGDAADYFDPYSVRSIAAALGRFFGPAGAEHRVQLAVRGAERALLYLPERVVPQWGAFLAQLCARA